MSKPKFHFFPASFEWVLAPEPKAILMFLPQVGEEVYFSKVLYVEYDSTVLCCYNKFDARFDPVKSAAGFPSECRCITKSVRYEVDSFLCMDGKYLPTVMVNCTLELIGPPTKAGLATTLDIRIAPFYNENFVPIPAAVEFVVPMSRVQRGLSQGFVVGSEVAVPFVDDQDASRRNIFVGIIKSLFSSSDANGTSYFRHASVQWVNSEDSELQEVAIWELFKPNVTENEVIEWEKPEGLRPKPAVDGKEDEFSAFVSKLEPLRNTDAWKLSFGKIPRGRPDGLVGMYYVTPYLISQRVVSGYYRSVEALVDEIRQLIDTCERFLVASTTDVRENEKSRIKEYMAGFKSVVGSARRAGYASSTPAVVSSSSVLEATSSMPPPFESPGLPLLTPTPSGSVTDSKRKRIPKLKEDPSFEFEPQRKKSKISPDRSSNVASASATPGAGRTDKEFKGRQHTDVSRPTPIETPLSYSVSLDQASHAVVGATKPKTTKIVRRPTITSYSLLTPAPSSQPAFRIDHPFEEQVRLKELSELWASALGPGGEALAEVQIAGPVPAVSKTKISPELEHFLTGQKPKGLLRKSVQDESLRTISALPLDFPSSVSTWVHRIVAVPIISDRSALSARLDVFLGKCEKTLVSKSLHLYHRSVFGSPSSIVTQVFAIADSTHPAHVSAETFTYARVNVGGDGIVRHRPQNLLGVQDLEFSVERIMEDEPCVVLTVRHAKGDSLENCDVSVVPYRTSGSLMV